MDGLWGKKRKNGWSCENCYFVFLCSLRKYWTSNKQVDVCLRRKVYIICLSSRYKIWNRSLIENKLVFNSLFRWLKSYFPSQIPSKIITENPTFPIIQFPIISIYIISWHHKNDDAAKRAKIQRILRKLADRHRSVKLVIRRFRGRHQRRSPVPWDSHEVQSTVSGTLSATSRRTRGHVPCCIWG